MKCRWLWLAPALFLAGAAAESLHAIPAFARKYQMSCKTCHSPFPRIKEYGEEFAANGFVLKDKDAPRYTTDTGDGSLSLLRDLPFALRLEGYLAYNQGKSRKFEVQAPYIIKLLSGGSITRGIAYYFYFFFSERGEVAGLEDAFLYFSDLFKTGISLAAGQFQVSDPLYKRELRLPFEDYRIYSKKVDDSSVSLTYDRGLMFGYTLPSKTDVTFSLINGSGLNPADPLGRFDGDRYKNLFAVVSQDLGKHLRLGVCGYSGKEGKEGIVNSTWMLGANITFSFPKLELNMQYLERRDDNPGFRSGIVRGCTPKVATRGGFAELIFTPRGDDSKWYAAFLANWVQSDLEESTYRSASMHWGYLLRRNLRFVAECTGVLRSPEGKYTRFGIGLVTAF